jgi:hypothetical protein
MTLTMMPIMILRAIAAHADQLPRFHGRHLCKHRLPKFIGKRHILGGRQRTDLNTPCHVCPQAQVLILNHHHH